MSHRGEGSVYREKTPPDKQMPGPPGSGKPVIVPPSQAMPDPQRMRAEQPPPPPPLPGSGFGEGVAMPTQSELAKKLAESQATHSLAAHRIVDRLRATLTNIANLAESAKRDLSDTVGARTIIIHGPTGTGKSCARSKDGRLPSRLQRRSGRDMDQWVMRWLVFMCPRTRAPDRQLV